VGTGFPVLGPRRDELAEVLATLPKTIRSSPPPAISHCRTSTCCETCCRMRLRPCTLRLRHRRLSP